MEMHEAMENQLYRASQPSSGRIVDNPYITPIFEFCPCRG
jgi:hypothetical protein